MQAQRSQVQCPSSRVAAGTGERLITIALKPLAES